MIQRDVVVLHGVVGVLPKETIWLILDSKWELDHQFNRTQLLKKFLGCWMQEILILNSPINQSLKYWQMITLALLLNKLMTPTYQDVLAITVLDTNLWKKLLLNVVTPKDVVVLLGVVGVLPKETIWLILDSNWERVHKP